MRALARNSNKTAPRGAKPPSTVASLRGEDPPSSDRMTCAAASFQDQRRCLRGRKLCLVAEQDYADVALVPERARPFVLGVVRSNRISEKCPSGGIGRRPATRTPPWTSAHCPKRIH